MDYVIDASVAIKWFLVEPDSQKALQLHKNHLLQKIKLNAPQLILYEINNVLATKTALSQHQAKEGIKILYQTNLTVHNFDLAQAQHTTKLAKDLSLSAYDATYLSLAQQLSCQLITADKHLYQKTKKAHNVLLF